VSRYPSGLTIVGPGAITPAVRAIIVANVAIYLITFLLPEPVVALLGLTPRDVVGRGWLWQPVTYLFVHEPRGLFHILFNMLALWMFGVELERRWGTVAFVKYYFIAGVGAGVCVLLTALLPFESTRAAYAIPTIGASGAIFGLLLAWAMVFPNRTILFMLIFPLPARVFALIMGAIAFLGATSAAGPVSHVAHLGGMVIGWFYLKGPHNLRLELQYRLARWRMERMRRKFNVHRGGRDDWGDRIH
jgi:membrane associated rhomboid family serine protease